MFNTSRHPSDQQIIQLIDSELSTNRAEQLKQHLATCPACQNRQATMESLLNALNKFYDSEEIVEGARIAGSRIHLQETLAEFRRSPSPHHIQLPVFHARLPIVALTVLAVVGLTFYLGPR